MSFFKCLGYACLGAPPGRPWAQSATPGRFTTANPIQPIPAGELSGHRSGDRATDAPREPTTGHRSEDRVAEKAPQNNSYLESYTTTPDHRLGPCGAGLFYPTASSRKIYYCRPYTISGGWVATGDSSGAQARSPAKGSVCAKSAFLKALEARGSDQCRRQERREGVPERTNNA